ncbi:hypothetical protein PsYK624_120050 [Phanerochaete sordida]|uniref:Uncharacterized protein n=1 Tax=Phanerochaete sordida TaxID=48140 RepID=A0A9P3LHY6_9APHY|nr:hypothetical protein PsYK624_120050 [Phanerochaete sordida]
MPHPHLKLVLDHDIDDVVDWVELEYEIEIARSSGNKHTFTKSYNLRQDSVVPVIYRRTPTNPAPVVDAMQWRLIPREWFMDQNRNYAITKVETIVKSDFYKLRARHRCAAICQGFYVWRNKGQTP